jgi:hypothetical protein
VVLSRKLLLTFLFSAVIMVGFGSLSASAAKYHRELEVAQQSTVVRVYRPFKGTRINPALHVRRRVKGFCWTGSQAAFRRRDAWRCLWGGRFIVDPCFAGPSRSIGYVLCPDQVWNNGVERLQLNRPLPTHSENKQRLGSVWAIVTSGDLRCKRDSGQIPLVAGKPRLYDCGRQGGLAGEPDTTHPLWTIFFSPAAHPTRLSRTGIATAWR